MSTVSGSMAFLGLVGGAGKAKNEDFCHIPTSSMLCVILVSGKEGRGYGSIRMG